MLLFLALALLAVHASSVDEELSAIEADLNTLNTLGGGDLDVETEEDKKNKADAFFAPYVPLTAAELKAAAAVGASDRTSTLSTSPLPLSYVAFCIIPLVLGAILFAFLYRRFSVQKGEPLLGEQSSTFSTQQKVILGAVLIGSALLALAIAFGVALPGRVGESAVTTSTARDAGFIEYVYSLAAQKMGGTVTRPGTLGKGCCCGRLGCNFGQMDVSGQCGRGPRNVCASGTSNARTGVLVHEVMHLYLYHLNGFGLTGRTMMDERFTDCLTLAVSGSLWTYYGCGSGLAEAQNLLARYPPSNYPWGKSCFPADSTVVANGTPVSMAELKIGDTVEDANGSTTVFLGWMKRLDTESTAMSRIEYAHNNATHSVSLTPHHLLRTTDGSMLARDIDTSHILLLADNEFGPVLSHAVGHQKGALAPLTLSGTLVVNGAVVSNYAGIHPDDETLVHSLFAPIRALYYVLPSSTFEYIMRNDGGWHGYAGFLNNIHSAIGDVHLAALLPRMALFSTSSA